MKTATAADVVARQAEWSVECADCVTWLGTLPDDSIDLLVTSPPYEGARSYGIGFDLWGQDWVDWMVTVVRAAAPKVKGLMAIVCEGTTDQYAYSVVPFLLMADLHRAGFNLRKPPTYARVGIPGSGGPDWLRNDWEPVVCVTRKGRLPWSDNLACGEKPKYRTGGPCTHRRPDGTRFKKKHTKRGRDGSLRTPEYAEPEIANPGNVIEDEVSNVVRCQVGNGHMGHPLAHENEAPFPMKLATFFVASFCPPGGVVCEPFCGSGTTVQAAIELNRRAIACDVRQSQVELTRRRLALGVTKSMF